MSPTRAQRDAFMEPENCERNRRNRTEIRWQDMAFVGRPEDPSAGYRRFASLDVALLRSCSTRPTVRASRCPVHEIMKAFRIVLTFLALFSLSAAENPYPPGPDSQKQEGVPQGEVIKGVFTAGTNSVFPGTVRDFWRNSSPTSNANTASNSPPTATSGPSAAPAAVQFVRSPRRGNGRRNSAGCSAASARMSDCAEVTNIRR